MTLDEEKKIDSIDFKVFRYPFFAKFTKENQKIFAENYQEIIKTSHELPLNFDYKDFLLHFKVDCFSEIRDAVYLYIKKYEYFLSMYSPEYRRNQWRAFKEHLNYVPYTKADASSKLAFYSFEQIINIFIQDKVFHKGFRDSAMWLLEDAIDFMLFFGRIRIVDAEEQKGNLYRDFQVEDRRDPII